MSKGVQLTAHGTAPDKGYRSLTPADQTEIPFPAASELDRIGDHVEAVYGAMREAVETFGGTVAFAAAAEVPVPKMSMRLRRADDGKSQQLAHLDYLGVLAADPAARMTFLAALSDLWGCMPPQPKRVATQEEQLAALLAEIEDMNGTGKDLLKRAAKRIGADAGAFRRPR